MKLKRVFVFLVSASVLYAPAAFAVATFSCAQAKEFIDNPNYKCGKSSIDCSRGECVDIAKCSFIKGLEGFTMTFSYPTNCSLELPQYDE